MSAFTYRLEVSPNTVSLDGQTVQLNRIVMSDVEGNLVGWADYVIHNGWSKFTEVVVVEEHRTEENVMAFIRNGYGLVPEPKQTFWWSATPSMAKYFDLIVAERPDMTFAAGGTINRICRATK
jgi:hypothetical protein